MPDGAEPIDNQLEMVLGPLYVVEVEERLTTRLSRRSGRAYAAPPQPLEDARRLAALLLDADEAPAGEGPWRRPLAGGHRLIRLVRAPAAPPG
jgi:hypothetical protein